MHASRIGHGVGALVSVAQICAAAPPPTVIDWAAPVSAPWTSASAWSIPGVFPNNGSPLPDDTYHARVMVDASPFIIAVSSDVTIDEFTLDSSPGIVNHTGGVFRVNNTAHMDAGEFRLNGGTVAGGTWSLNGARFLATSNDNNRIDNVTFTDRALGLDPNARLRIRNGVNLSGNQLVINSGARVTFEGDTVFNDHITSYAGIVSTYNSDLTIAPGSTVDFQSMTFQTIFGRFTNQGAMSGTGLRVDPSVREFVNDASIVSDSTSSVGLSASETVNNGLIAKTRGSVILGAELSWATTSNANGIIDLTDADLHWRGNSTIADIGTITRTGATNVYHEGALDLAGATLDLASYAGDLIIRGGSIANGTVLLRPEAGLAGFEHGPSVDRDNIFDNVAIAGGDLNVAGRLVVRNGLELNGNSILGASSVTPLVFDGDQAFNGRIAGTRPIEITFGSELTFGPQSEAVFMRYQAVTDGSSGSAPTFVNNGVLSGGTFEASLDRATNNGTIRGAVTARTELLNRGFIDVTPGSHAIFQAEWSNQQGMIHLGENATMRIEHPARLEDLGSITRDTGSLLELRADLGLGGGTLDLASTGALVLRGGEIHGGTILQTPDARLEVSKFGSSVLRNVTVAGGDLLVTGNVTIRNNVAFDDAGIQLVNDSRVTFDNIGSYNGRIESQSSASHLDPVLDVSDAGSLVLGRDSFIEARNLTILPPSLESGKSLILRGTLQSTQFASTVGAGSFENDGLIRVSNNSVLYMSATFTNLSGFTLSRGKWHILEGSEIRGGSLISPTTLEDIEIVLGGSGAAFGDYLEAITTITADASLTITDNADFNAAGSMLVSGAIGVGPDSTFRIPQTLDLEEAGRLEFFIGGTPQGTRTGDILVTGDALLDGTLRLATIDGWRPIIGETLTLINASSIVGAFDALVFQPKPGGIDAVVHYTETSVFVEFVVPAPGVLATLPLVFAAARRRR